MSSDDLKKMFQLRASYSKISESQRDIASSVLLQMMQACSNDVVAAIQSKPESLPLMSLGEAFGTIAQACEAASAYDGVNPAINEEQAKNIALARNNALTIIANALQPKKMS